VTETAGGHCFELDDSPGSARVRLGHTEGQFLEMHQNGVTVLKSVNDLFLLSPRNIIIVAKAGQVIKVEGNAVFSVEGNMLHEVHGNMQQIVRGNYELSVAGQLNLNGGEEVQIRAAALRVESNVENINIKAAKFVKIQSGQSIHMKSGENIFQQAENSINIKAGDDIFTQSTNFNIKSTDMFLEAEANANLKAGSSAFIQSNIFNLKSTGMFLEAVGNGNFKAGHAKIGGGTKVSINAATVAIDDVIQLASGQAANADGASEATGAEEATGAFVATATELPEPAVKSAGNGSGGGGGGILGGGGYKSPSISGSGGYVSQDDGGRDDGGSGETTDTASSGLTPSYTQDALTPLLDLISKSEGAGYDTIFGGISRSDYPSKSLTSMTIREILDWQESIDPKYEGVAVSEAVGRYQIVEDTLRGFDNNIRSASGKGLYTRAGLTLDSLFSPGNQDLLAIELLKIRGLNRFLSGDTLFGIEEFGNNLSKEWARLPIMSGPKAGKGRYSGQDAKATVQEVTDALKKVKDYKSSDSTIGNVKVGPQ
jgi:muramidase (phage lysozyme)